MGNIVGNIEGYDVIYIPEKDCIFCKNTLVPFQAIRKCLSKDIDRFEITEKQLSVRIYNTSIEFGCLTTSVENCKNIQRQVNKIKDDYNTSKERSCGSICSD
jgi:hypothetical protein